MIKIYCMKNLIKIKKIVIRSDIFFYSIFLIKNIMVGNHVDDAA